MLFRGIDNEVGLVLALKPGEADLSVRLLERSSGREIARKGRGCWNLLEPEMLGAVLEPHILSWKHEIY